MVENTEKELKHEYLGDIYNAHGSSNSKGVSIFINKHLNYSLINKFEDSEGRLILLNVEIDDTIYTLLNLYAPNKRKDRNSFFLNVLRIIEEHRQGILIIGGDMNETLQQIDRISSVGENRFQKPVNNMRLMIKKCNLIDIWRELNFNKKNNLHGEGKMTRIQPVE